MPPYFNMIDSNTIQKYKGKSLSYLLNRATFYFNSYIRERDKDKTCVSCRQHKELQAGHFYSGGHYPELRFNENNVHGQCVRCNMYLSGNLNEYRKNIIFRISQKELEKLDMVVEFHRRSGFKWDRIALIEIIEKYKNK